MVEPQSRRLAAILAADVVGYSRLMGADEAQTLTSVKSAIDKAVKPALEAHNGRLVKLMGDGILAEFGSVVDAVRCAVAIQTEMASRGTDVSEDCRVCLRIGINLGDIIFEDGDIFGDGVNVASRLEGIADPGGICVSRTVADQVGAKAGVTFQSLGLQSLKNISEPIEAFSVLLDGTATPRANRYRSPMRLAAFAVAVFVAASAWWVTSPDFTPADPTKMTQELPEGPSIAVLPFDYLGSDGAEKEYIADGLSENIISALARLPNTLVIARSSTFTYKGKAADVREVSEKFGVRYILEGSVQLSGETIRVTAQLVDGVDGKYLWTDTYDRPVDDIFAVQDEITLFVAQSIQRRTYTTTDYSVTDSARATQGTRDLEAWTLHIKGNASRRRYTPQALAESRKLIEKAISLDPSYSQAYSSLALAYFFEARFGIAKDPAATLAKAADLAKKAHQLEPNNYYADTALAITRLMQRRPGDAKKHALRAFEAAPGDSDAVALLGWVLKYAGDSRAAIPYFIRAKRIYVIPPWWVVADEFGANIDIGDHDAALKLADEWVERGPPAFRAHFLAIAAVPNFGLGNVVEAERLIAEALALDPNLSIQAMRRWDVPYIDTSTPERKYAILRQLGLPDTPPPGD
ncbi:adenylate/guanylate cyclase domain-containing protein [Sulfitobacter mediterraneus]|uniref:TolB-like protein n=1 Tax=Sulfitobacter mediterraneus TaxID=83219 RepID=A0A2T6CJY0_9RHOB|nr:adenylate/guanylate cyclase domain-containing protein [Sulfitobacter mediterraneus]KIN78795.1 Adenylate/guanylate cyclase [Sulfitobacter mediterraneus KCTC 32188]PTX75815.1 TolB-like protein [Sulfitobacter mediterraneus]